MTRKRWRKPITTLLATRESAGDLIPPPLAEAGSEAAPLVVASRWRTRVEKKYDETREEWHHRLLKMAALLRSELTSQGPIETSYGPVLVTVEDPGRSHENEGLRAYLSEPELLPTDISGWCWTERLGVSSEHLRLADDALKSALKLAERHLGPDCGRFRIMSEEYISVALPPDSVRRLDGVRLSAALKCGHADLVDQRLYLGPGTDARDSLEKLLREHEEARSRERWAKRLEPDPPSRWKFLHPLLLFLALLLTWAAPIGGWAAVLGLCLATLFFVGVVTHLLVGYEGRWSERLTRAPVAASAGLTGILGFGIAYAVIALIQEDALGEDAIRLGDAFLISTTIGVAGGLLGGDLKIAARIVAHIQLLLFLGGLVAVGVALLRILDQTRSSRDQ